MKTNPVFKKELKIMARTKQLSVMAVVFNSVLTVIVGLVLYIIADECIYTGTSPYKYMMAMYLGIMSIELFMLSLLLPSVASESIAGERERQTLDILLSSRLSASDILMGKLLSSVSMAVIMIVSSLPVLTLCLIYGGIHLTDIYQSIAYAGFLILMIGSIGVFCSSHFKSTTHAAVSSYSIIIGITLATVILVILLNMADAAMLSSDAEHGFGYGWIGYIWLINPAITYAVIMFNQLGYADEVLEIFLSIGISDQVMQYWIVLSIVAQTIVSALILKSAVSFLNPLNNRHEGRRRGKDKPEKKQKKLSKNRR